MSSKLSVTKITSRIQSPLQYVPRHSATEKSYFVNKRAILRFRPAFMLDNSKEKKTEQSLHLEIISRKIESIRMDCSKSIRLEYLIKKNKSENLVGYSLHIQRISISSQFLSNLRIYYAKPIQNRF